ncbi:MAG TPA: FGGY family carbohydrate kinase [Gaiellaceae bacterium]|nr:FGGY family carbohydrate kinase [Gaiellaceae bacterium]
MNEETVLGIDIGTSATKAVLVRADGTVLAVARRQHAITMPRPGWAELNAETVWWHDVKAVCAELVPHASASLTGVCVSGIGPCVVPCDGSLRPLRPAILYGIDTRATAEADELTARLGHDAILERGGSTLSSQALGPKLLWLRRHEPEIWEAASGWYMASSFVVARLTGEYVLDHHSASQCDPLYDLEGEGWAAEWIDEVAPGIPFPRLQWPAEVVGTVSAAAAAATGLPAGTPVVCGTIDAWAEAFSAGVRQPGQAMLMYGSTMFFIQIACGAHPHRLLWTTQGIEPGTRTYAAGTATGGSLTEWIRDLVGRPNWPTLVAEAGAAPPGARGLLVLPHFAGERTPIYDPLARGVVAGLTLRHRRGDILRAAYEGIGCGIRQILELLETRPDRLVAVGGGTQATLWMQVVTDVTDVPQDVPEQTIGAAYGDALLAAIGTRLVPQETDWTRIKRVIEPDDTLREVYDGVYRNYPTLYAATSGIVRELQELSA